MHVNQNPNDIFLPIYDWHAQYTLWIACNFIFFINEYLILLCFEPFCNIIYVQEFPCCCHILGNLCECGTVDIFYWRSTDIRRFAVLTLHIKWLIGFCLAKLWEFILKMMIKLNLPSRKLLKTWYLLMNWTKC